MCSLTLCLYVWLWTWFWYPRGDYSGRLLFGSSQVWCLCAAIKLAESAPTERGEMCLTYAQRTRSGRLEQQDTINDHRIRLLQYGFLSPPPSSPWVCHISQTCLPVCVCIVFVLCAFVGQGPFYPLFLLSFLLCLSVDGGH